jgi:hypothetical protein
MVVAETLALLAQQADYCSDCCDLWIQMIPAALAKLAKLLAHMEVNVLITLTNVQLHQLALKENINVQLWYVPNPILNVFV